MQVRDWARSRHPAESYTDLENDIPGLVLAVLEDGNLLVTLPRLVTIDRHQMATIELPPDFVRPRLADRT